MSEITFEEFLKVGVACRSNYQGGYVPQGP